jgi:hypothetical protein
MECHVDPEQTSHCSSRNHFSNRRERDGQARRFHRGIVTRPPALRHTHFGNVLASMTGMEVSKSSGQLAFVVLVRARVRIDRSWESEGRTDPTMLGSYRRMNEQVKVITTDYQAREMNQARFGCAHLFDDKRGVERGWHCADVECSF